MQIDTTNKVNQNKNQAKNNLFFLICAAILCILPIINMKYGWFDWQSLEKPPERVVKIIAIDRESVWVKTASGEIYYNEKSDECQKDCWVVTTETPTETPTETFIQDGIPRKLLNTTCSPAPPLIGVVDSMAECFRGEWADSDSIYVLRFDGSLAAWHFGSNGEFYPVKVLFDDSLLLVTIIFFTVCIVKQARKVKISNVPAVDSTAKSSLRPLPSAKTGEGRQKRID